MKFTVTSLVDIAASLTAENFEDLASGSTSVLVDIRNPSATVTNLKAAAVVKLKLKDPMSLRLVAVMGMGGTDNARQFKILDDLEADRKAVLTTVFGNSSGDVAVQLYCLRAADVSSDAVYGAVLAAGKLAVAGAVAAAPASEAPLVAPAGSSDAAADGAEAQRDTSAGGTKRTRDEGADDGDRATLAASPVAPAKADAPAPATSTAATTTPAASAATRARARQAQRGGAITAPGDDDGEWEDDDDNADDDDDDDDDSDAFEEFHEGDEWGSDDDGDDEIDWITNGMDMGLVPELAPAERELITELVSLPTAGTLLQQVMEGKTAEAMAEVQTANPRLFALIGEHSGLFTELMEDVKEMLESGIITSPEGIIEHLKAMVEQSNEADALYSGEEDDEDFESDDDEAAAVAAAGEEGNDTASPATEGADGGERRRQRRKRRMEGANMTDALNAFAGGASEVRPMTDVDEARITSLVELGFDRTKAVAAYLRMGRNVERAANHLFETM